jgi:hypothetical protein
MVWFRWNNPPRACSSAIVRPIDSEIRGVHVLASATKLPGHESSKALRKSS